MTELVEQFLAKEDNKKLSNKIIEIVEAFDEENINLGLAYRTRHIQLYYAFRLIRDIGKDFDAMTKEDIRECLRTKRSRAYKETWKSFFLKFFRWFGRPVVVDWIKPAKNIKSKKKAEDMLTEQEVQKLIDACDNLRDKTTIALFFDTAIRLSELAGIDVGDVTNDGSQVTVTVTGKGGTVRTLGLISSAPYVLRLLENHPYKHDRRKPLFLSYNHKNYHGRIGIGSVQQMVKMAAKRTDIDKIIHPHLFRHSRLTQLARLGMNESMMRRFAGWSKNSSAPSTYIHLNSQDVIDMTRELVTGERPKEKKLGSILLPVKCPRCGMENEVTRDYCRQCWLPLSQKGVSRTNELVELLKSDYAQLHGIDIDKLLRDYQYFKVETQQLQQIYEIFNGSDILATDMLRRQLGWPDNDVLNILGYLVSAELISQNDLQNGIVKINKEQFHSFIQMQKRYVKTA